jgi:hypothetical protein
LNAVNPDEGSGGGSPVLGKKKLHFAGASRKKTSTTNQFGGSYGTSTRIKRGGVGTSVNIEKLAALSY